MSDSIHVLQYKNGNSNKVWAIDSRQNSDGGHDIWYGRSGAQLQHKPMNTAGFQRRLQSKIGKGYVRMTGVTIDRDRRVVVLSNSQEDDLENIPESYWYRINTRVPEQQIRDWLKETLNLLAKQFRQQAEILESLPVFQSLAQGKRNGGAELSEGPLAVLLLFGLRRYLRGHASALASKDDVEIADDNNTLLTNDFEKLCKQIKAGTEFKEMRKSISLADFKKYAIVLGACDAPVDLISIQSDTKAAFF